MQSSVQFAEYLGLLIAERKTVFKVKYLYGFSLRTHYISLFLEHDRSEKSSPSNNGIFGGINKSINKKQLMN